MEERKKELIAVAALISSMLLIVIGFFMLRSIHIADVPIVSAAFMILCVVCLASGFAAVRYSKDGWRIKGSVLEWIIAAIIAPFWAIVFYFHSRRQERGKTIDPHDYERLKGL